jgi:hypothetical protein
MRRPPVVPFLLALLPLAACQPELTPAERAAKDRSECQALASSQSGFDPLTAEEPVRTVSSTSRRGGSTEEAVGDVVKGAAGGAVLGVVGGAIMGDVGEGAGAGAAIGGLIGGVKHYQKRNETVTHTHTNPEYQQYVQARQAFKSAFDACLAERAAGVPQ